MGLLPSAASVASTAVQSGEIATARRSDNETARVAGRIAHLESRRCCPCRDCDRTSRRWRRQCCRTARSMAPARERQTELRGKESDEERATAQAMQQASTRTSETHNKASTRTTMCKQGRNPSALTGDDGQRHGARWMIERRIGAGYAEADRVMLIERHISGDLIVKTQVENVNEN